MDEGVVDEEVGGEAELESVGVGGEALGRSGDEGAGAEEEGEGVGVGEEAAAEEVGVEGDGVG